MKTRWPTVALGELVDEPISYGANVSSTDFDPVLPRYIRITDIDEHGRLLDDRKVSARLDDPSPYLLQAGDILLARSGATVGKSYLHRSGMPQSVFAGYLLRVRANQRRLLPGFLRAQLETGNYWAWVRSTCRAGAQPNINAQEYSRLRVSLPSTAVQRACLEALGWLDARFLVLEDLLAAKRRLKRALTQRLLAAGKGLRRYPLRALTAERSERNGTLLGADRAMGVIKGEGLVPMRDEVRAADVSRYKLVRPGAFAYNPMRINIGSIAYSWQDDDVMVSPDYVVFECDRAKLLPRYLDHVRHSGAWKAFMSRAGNGSVRVRIYYADLAQFTLALPTIQAQARVAAVLDALDREVALAQNLLAALRLQKRAVMQKLLSGEIVLPEKIT